MRIFKRIFAIGGLLVGALIFLISIIGIRAPKIEMLETKGIIVEIKEYNDTIGDGQYYTTYVDYKVDNKEYKHVEYGAYNSSMDVGDEVVVKYDPKEPEHIEAPNADKVPYITAACSIVCVVIFGVLLIKG